MRSKMLASCATSALAVALATAPVAAQSLIPSSVLRRWTFSGCVSAQIQLSGPADPEAACTVGTLSLGQDANGLYRFDAQQVVTTKPGVTVAFANLALAGTSSQIDYHYLARCGDPTPPSTTTGFDYRTWPNMSGITAPIAQLTPGFPTYCPAVTPFDIAVDRITPIFLLRTPVTGGCDCQEGIRTQFAEVSAVPEPASLALIGTGLFGLGGVSWYRRRV